MAKDLKTQEDILRLEGSRTKFLSMVSEFNQILKITPDMLPLMNKKDLIYIKSFAAHKAITMMNNNIISIRSKAFPDKESSKIAKPVTTGTGDAVAALAILFKTTKKTTDTSSSITKKKKEKEVEKTKGKPASTSKKVHHPQTQKGKKNSTAK